jgi:hypothetical protein
MDPYLEHPGFWPGVHHRLIAAIGDDLAAKLAPRYYVDVEERTVVALPGGGAGHPRPDVTVVDSGLREAAAAYAPAGPIPVEVPEGVRLGYLQVRTPGDNRVIAVIEVLSPFNKRPGAGRADYERKRLLLLTRPVHLVEIDLLRAGEPMVLGGAVPRSDYRILVSPWERRPSADLFPFDLDQPIPQITVPLLPGDEPAPLDVGTLAHGVYDRGQYRLRIDYRQEPEPPLATKAAEWADGLLRAAGLR